jgi:lysophospholipase L1-like esterase
MPWLPVRFEDRPGDHVVDVLVIGESSALGIPYDAWFSVGDIVAWKLGEAFPQMVFRVENQAQPGIPLQSMHTKLAGTKRRPELVILYAGHNEFMARFDVAHGAFHYADLTPPTAVTLEVLARRVSPLLRLMAETAQRLRVSTAPSRIVTRQLVDVPVYTPEQYAERLTEFRTRLGVIVSYCERIAAQVVLVIPPGNDAGFEPNRSFLRRDTSAAEREAFAAEFLAARRSETTNPREAEQAYRRLLERQPEFAESHYRLARLLEQTGAWNEAFIHYVAARDLDGLPMRLPSDFHRIYQDVAAAHPRAILVDGPAEFHGRAEHGLIDDVFFADGLHPSLNGYAALAQAILTRLRERRAVGWSADIPVPVVTALDCATHFQMDGSKWQAVCRYSNWFYNRTAYIRYDPTERLAKAKRYAQAAQALEGGTPPDSVGMPGVGPRPGPIAHRRN